jgi:hypothetical protein
MTSEVQNAIEEIRRTFEGHDVRVEPDGQGGAHIVVDALVIGDQYIPTVSWFGFTIPFQYPRADVYPHFIDSTVRRSSGQPLGPGFSGPTTWKSATPAIQVSRRSNHWDPANDTAAAKLLKVLEWVQKQ